MLKVSRCAADVTPAAAACRALLTGVVKARVRWTHSAQETARSARLQLLPMASSAPSKLLTECWCFLSEIRSGKNSNSELFSVCLTVSVLQSTVD